MKILILGASGQIGTVLLRFLQSKGLSLAGTSRSGVNDLKKFNPLKDDWNLLGKFDWLINCCGVIYEKSGEQFDQVHQGITERIIQNRTALGNPSIIQISVLGADAASDVPFFSTKANADNLLLQQQNTWVLRPSIVCTPGTMMVKKLKDLLKMSGLAGGFLPLPGGMTDKKIQPVMGKDVADICFSIIEKAPEENLINVTGPVEITFGQLFELMGSVNGRKIRILPLPEYAARILVKTVIDPLLPSLISYGQYKMIFSNNIADNGKVREILKRDPEDTIPFWEHELKINKHQF